MTGGRIGGALDYSVLADLNRPHIEGIRREALRLLSAGLSARDISMALRVSEKLVATWRDESEHGP